MMLMHWLPLLWMYHPLPVTLVLPMTLLDLWGKAATTYCVKSKRPQIVWFDVTLFNFLSPIVPWTRLPSGGLVIAKLREMFLGHSFREQPDESVLTRSVLGDDKFGLHNISIIQRTRRSDKKLSEVQPCCIECVWKSWMHWLNGSNVRAVDFKRDIQ